LVSSGKKIKKSDKWFVYILKCSDGSLYTGCTSDIKKRVKCHNEGKGARYTRARLPVKLVYKEKALGKGIALSREAGIKRLDRKMKLILISKRRKRRWK
jgi:putative endonuclease